MSEVREQTLYGDIPVRFRTMQNVSEVQSQSPQYTQQYGSLYVVQKRSASVMSRLAISHLHVYVRAQENVFWSGGWPTTATSGSGWLEV